MRAAWFAHGSRLAMGCRSYRACIRAFFVTTRGANVGVTTLLKINDFRTVKPRRNDIFISGPITGEQVCIQRNLRRHTAGTL